MAQLAEGNDAEDTEGTLGDQLSEYFMERGIERGRREALLRQLRRRFGEIPESAVARIKAADRPTLDLWLDRILTASTLDELWSES